PPSREAQVGFSHAAGGSSNGLSTTATTPSPASQWDLNVIDATPTIGGCQVAGPWSYKGAHGRLSSLSGKIARSGRRASLGLEHQGLPPARFVDLGAVSRLRRAPRRRPARGPPARAAAPPVPAPRPAAPHSPRRRTRAACSRPPARSRARPPPGPRPSAPARAPAGSRSGGAPAAGHDARGRVGV